MKSRLPVLVAFISGALMILAFFGRGTVVDAVSDRALTWQTIVGGFSLLLGAVSIARVHWKKVATKHEDRLYSLCLLICFIVMGGSGVINGIGSGTLFDTLFQRIQAPMMSTMFSVLAFFIASAAYRAFRARSVSSAILLVAAVLVMLGRIPMGQYIYHGLPSWADWIMTVPSMAVQRGILIGAALGAASMSLRIILGIERTYLGRG
ncbi:MAG: hypothetical protein HZB43_00500 [candidate division Zixibacteria bacterium]|nr:hypothetical protein [candidate division Zixibacteria bacterium]